MPVAAADSAVPSEDWTREGAEAREQFAKTEASRSGKRRFAATKGFVVRSTR